MIAHSKTTLTNFDLDSVGAALSNGKLTAGELTELFTSEFLKFTGFEHGLTTSSGSSALRLIIEAYDLINQEILIPNYICSSVLKAIDLGGAKARVYDNAEMAWIADLNSIEKRITETTSAIVVNYTFGQGHNLAKILKSKYPELIIIEDYCHAIPVNGKIANIDVLKGDVAFFSFNSTKMIATGEGGFIATNSAKAHSQIKEKCIDSGISDLNSSLGLSQIKQFSSFLEKRRKIASFYSNELGKYGKTTALKDSQFFRFPILLEMKPKSFESSIVAFRKGVDALIDCKSDELPNSQYVFDYTVSLPIYPTLSKIQMETVVKEFKRVFINA